MKKPNITRVTTVFANHLKMAQVTSSANVLAYNLLLSIFPLLIVVGNVLPLVGVKSATLLKYLSTVIPESIFNFIKPIITQSLSNGSGSLISVGAVVTLWSTSQAVAAFQRGVDQAYGVGENQNPILKRIVSFAWMIVVLAIMAILVLFYGVGEMALIQLHRWVRLDLSVVTLINQLRWPVAFFGVLIALSLLYYFVPNARVKYRYVFWGALTSTILWMWLSKVFSVYTVVFSRTVATYKTMGAFVVFMIWLDFSGLVLMIGAVINSTIQELREGQIQEKQLFKRNKKTPHQNEEPK